MIFMNTCIFILNHNNFSYFAVTKVAPSTSTWGLVLTPFKMAAMCQGALCNPSKMAAMCQGAVCNPCKPHQIHIKHTVHLQLISAALSWQHHSVMLQKSDQGQAKVNLLFVWLMRASEIQFTWDRLNTIFTLNTNSNFAKFLSQNMHIFRVKVWNNMTCIDLNIFPDSKPRGVRP